ncbi:hypothetical protein Q4493_00215 [Colwellia sp. 1_MG-2023]|uniref:hypothetical protein n=1 Tax=Colwellia sp. 1_MG-2023 TaxID=3062649 RepID=UPI0026E2BBD5|nr:hypothetical protein [Colwellia sp. 1_MG-2023]MDO6444187.1 hypothetical protein [Colwellia sp. 1_MG-2023]
MDELNNNFDAGSVYLEQQILKDFSNKQSVTSFVLPLNNTSIIIPAEQRLPARHLQLKFTEDKDKTLLFRLCIAAINYAYTDEFAPATAKRLVNSAVHFLVCWMNSTKISNRYSALKEYESYMFDKRQSHGGNSELKAVKSLFCYAYQYQKFVSSLLAEEASYLAELRKTKISPNVNKQQISIASYFGALDWLRSDKVGIGNQLYLTLASAKLTIKSLRATASVLIIESYKAKLALRKFLNDSGFSANDFNFQNSKNLTRSQRKTVIGKCIYELLCKYHDGNEKGAYLTNAIDFILLSNVTNRKNYDLVRQGLDSRSSLNDAFCTKVRHSKRFSNWFTDKTFKALLKGEFFSFELLQQLADSNAPIPITPIEVWMFHWLMASLTVQPSDIPKLSKRSFRLLKVGTRVTHIECEYFKGRSNAVHNTRTLSVRKLEGRALLTLLNQNIFKVSENIGDTRPTLSSTLDGRCGLFNAILQLPFMSEQLSIAHRQNGKLPLAIPTALNAVISFGKHTGNIVSNPKDYSIEQRQTLVLESETPSHLNILTLQAIKNSAVHAFSDPYTLHYLINRNSHTNNTEKLHYLGPDNEEFMNSAGRITRSIMQDLINNVYDISFDELSGKERDKAKAAFNYEFGNVAEAISYKTGEILSRLKIVTEQGKGKINEVGILALSGNKEDVFQPIYVLDSKVTAFKILNYLHEFRKHYKKLLGANPDFLYQTVFSNVEWMERVLTKLSKRSLNDGEELFQNMLRSGLSVSVFHET